MSEKVFFHTAHKALWNWLSKNPDHKTKKRHWPGWDFNGGNVKKTDSDCFACEYQDSIDPIYDTLCTSCPIVWPNNAKCGHVKGVFDAWEYSRNEETRSKRAAQIRDLPVREGVVCK